MPFLLLAFINTKLSKELRGYIIWQQTEINLIAKKRGFHLITEEIHRQLTNISSIECGILHLFIKHSSASLTINENADPTVRTDMEKHFNVIAPERAPYYQHIYEDCSQCLLI